MMYGRATEATAEVHRADFGGSAGGDVQAFLAALHDDSASPLD